VRQEQATVAGGGTKKALTIHRTVRRHRRIVGKRVHAIEKRSPELEREQQSASEEAWG
jgi:hypothetical protein